ncbi:mitochondrial ribonuclease P catalytic subunit-like isoform X2 [Ylistrum balloti]|uniref:mitochondrial ribonuclease P catalytic subunit-like isoform X2 n=1 Tax=Ylistrum balloti TaxID=509963 RepID=UPI0029059284|nr:mitochondrial ribonuclease P catalytic subunit-like isoform X2 [Ylistrum balloti]
MFSKIIRYRPSGLIQLCTYRHGCLLLDRRIVKPLTCTCQTHSLQFKRTLFGVEKSNFGDPTFKPGAVNRMKRLTEELVSTEQSLDVNVLRSALQRENLFNEEIFPYITLQMVQKTRQSFETVEQILQDLDRAQFDIPELVLLLHIFATLQCEDLVFSTYDRMCEISDGVFDFETLLTVIQILSFTSRWRECFKLLDLCLIIKPSIQSGFDYILAATARAGDFHTFCDIIVKMDNLVKLQQFQPTSQNLPLSLNVFVEGYLSAVERGVEHFTFENLFFLMKKYQFFVKEENIASILTQLESFLPEDPYIKRWNHVPMCEVCGSALNRQELTNEEFEELCHAYFSQSNTNVYLKNNPSETKKLKQVIHSLGPFDVVIDHLNTCFRGGQFDPQHSLSIVKQLKNRGLSCLLITRARYFKSLKPYLKTELEEYATIFISKSESLDDLIVLDATFFSGINTMLLSNDKFSDHASLLGTGMHLLFQRWQRCRQILRSQTAPLSTVELFFPQSPDTFVQESENGWHIPFGQKTFHFQDKKVLCVRRKRV